MVCLKPSKSEDVNGGPKYGYLSEIDPDFEHLRKATEESFDALWAMDIESFKTAWRTTPPALPDGSPRRGIDIEITDSEAPVRDGTKVPIRIYKSAQAQQEATLYLKAHGGGWVVGGHETEEAENRYVGNMPDVIVVSVDYRMAPEYKYPYAVNDCFDVLKWCKSNAEELGINPEKIIVGGGSSGGNIAAVVAQMCRDEGVSGLIGQILNIPVTCHPAFFPKFKYEYFSYSQNNNSPVVDAPKMEWFWEQYMPEPKPEAYASPLLAKSLSNLPPALVQVAGMDPLRDEGLAYAEAMEMNGVEVQVRTFQGLPHGFYMFPHLPATLEYIKNVTAFIETCKGGK